MPCICRCCYKVCIEVEEIEGGFFKDADGNIYDGNKRHLHKSGYPQVQKAREKAMLDPKWWKKHSCKRNCG
jgi:hypothetical protein